MQLIIPENILVIILKAIRVYYCGYTLCIAFGLSAIGSPVAAWEYQLQIFIMN